MKFRTLRADEIELRVGNAFSTGYSLLLYKDARCDMNILDETLGAENWQRDHKEIKGNLYCGVGVWDKEKSQWIWKWDCGTESNTEKEKGEASDSFKRACVNCGIGRELYTSPNIIIDCEMDSKKVGERTVYIVPYNEQKRRFKVKEIQYNDKREISKLVIVDNKGVQVFPKNYIEKNQKEEKKVEEVCCENCGCVVTDNVAKYSKQKYCSILCYKCQKEFKIKEVEV